MKKTLSFRVTRIWLFGALVYLSYLISGSFSQNRTSSGLPQQIRSSQLIVEGKVISFKEKSVGSGYRAGGLENEEDQVSLERIVKLDLYHAFSKEVANLPKKSQLEFSYTALRGSKEKPTFKTDLRFREKERVLVFLSQGKKTKSGFKPSYQLLNDSYGKYMVKEVENGNIEFVSSIIPEGISGGRVDSIEFIKLVSELTKANVFKLVNQKVHRYQPTDVSDLTGADADLSQLSLPRYQRPFEWQPGWEPNVSKDLANSSGSKRIGKSRSIANATVAVSPTADAHGLARDKDGRNPSGQEDDKNPWSPSNSIPIEGYVIFLAFLGGFVRFFYVESE